MLEINFSNLSHIFIQFTFSIYLQLETWLVSFQIVYFNKKKEKN